MEERKDENFIFFLVKKSEGPPRWLNEFSQKFSPHKIKIIPISLKQIIDFSELEIRPHLIVATPGLKLKLFWEKALNSLLGVAVKKGKIHVYHLSSFKGVPSLLALKNKKIYSHYPLPSDMDFLCKDISKCYFDSQQNQGKKSSEKKLKMPSGLRG